MVTKGSMKQPASAARGELGDEREARLAKALRANLKRRKEQARARKVTDDRKSEN